MTRCQLSLKPSRYKNLKEFGLNKLKADIAKIKPGRLTQQNFEAVKVVAYGEKRPLAELVQFIPKTANTVAMNVFDEGMVTDIIKVKNYLVKKKE